MLPRAKADAAAYLLLPTALLREAVLPAAKFYFSLKSIPRLVGARVTYLEDLPQPFFCCIGNDTGQIKDSRQFNRDSYETVEDYQANDAYCCEELQRGEKLQVFCMQQRFMRTQEAMVVQVFA